MLYHLVGRHVLDIAVLVLDEVRVGRGDRAPLVVKVLLRDRADLAAMLDVLRLGNDSHAI